MPQKNTWKVSFPEDQAVKIEVFSRRLNITPQDLIRRLVKKGLENFA